MKLYCTSASFVLAATALSLITIVNGEEGASISDSSDKQQQQHLHRDFEDDDIKVCSDEKNKEWHLRHMKVPEAWAYSDAQGKPSRGEGIVIAQIDTGYSDHPLFEGMFPDGEDAVKGMNMYHYIDGGADEEDLNDPRDPLPWDNIACRRLGWAHGTVVASAAMNRGTTEMKLSDKGEPIEGKWAPKGSAPKANLYSIRVVDNPAIGDNDAARIKKAFDLINDGTIEEDNVHVISISLARPTRIQNLKNKMYKAMDEKNVIIVAAGGQIANYVTQTVMWPAHFGRVIAVGGYKIGDDRATAYEDSVMTWWRPAASGPRIDISGPAYNVCNGNADRRNSDWERKKEGEDEPPIVNIYSENGEGTSLATAFTGGIAALWLGHHGREFLIDKFDKKNGIKLQEAFRKVLELTANQEGWDGNYDTRKYGYGMVDAEAIVQIDLDKVIKAIKEDNKSAMMDVVNGGSILSYDRRS